MAHKGKQTDFSTEWSVPIWDHQTECWISTRYDINGNLETTQTNSQGHFAIPRSPGQFFLTNNTLFEPVYDENGVEDTTLDSTFQDAIPEYRAGTECEVSSNFYADRNYQTQAESTSSDTESLATVRNKYPPYSNTKGYFDNSQTDEATGASIDNVTNNLARADINESSQALQNFPAPIPREGKTIRNSSSQNSTSSKKLDARYKVVEDKYQKKFWRIGRVFMVLWTEPARHNISHDSQSGPSTTGSSSSKFNKIYLEGTVFSEIRRFVVLQVGHGNTICSPIHTYGGQATLKPNLPERKQHAIIYTSDEAPLEVSYITPKTTVREDLIKDAIKVHREQDGVEGDLGTLSRLNYSKIYTVENYVKVLNIGVVESAWIPTLIRNSFVKPRAAPIEGPRNLSSRTHSHKDGSRDQGKGKEKGSGKKRRG